MSWWSEFLQFILCCCYVKEDDEYEHMNRKSEIYQFSPQTLSTPLVKQSNAYTTPNRHSQNSTDIFKLPEKSTSSHVPTRETRTKTSISTNLPQKIEASSVTTSVVANSATQYENSKYNVYERAKKVSQSGSSLSPEPHRPSSKPTIMSIASSTSTNTQGKTSYVCAHKTSSITPTVVSNSRTQYENTINKVDVSAGEFSQTLSSLSPKSPLVKQSNAYTSSNPHIQKSTDLLKSSEFLTNSTKTKASIPTKLPQKLNASSVTPSVFPSSATQYENSVNNVYDKFSQPGSSKPTIRSPAPSSSTNPQGKTKYVWAPKINVSSIKPTVVSNSTTQYENTINKVNESASEFSQTLSSLSPKPHRPSSKPTIMPIAPSSSTTTQGKNNYVFVQGATSPTYAIPEDLKVLFKRDTVPPVLKKTVSPSTYKEYFETLLYAEDYYTEKWDGFVMKNVTLELHEAAIYKRGGNSNVNEESDEKLFVALKMDSIPERRPFLLSRDFVFVSPSGEETASSFQGIIYRVVKSNLVLVEFEEDFHHQHNIWCKYDVKFSFNRVCLKRAHQAISAASNPLFQNFLFPDSMPKNNTPYIIEGPLSVKKTTCSSTTSGVVHETVLSKSGNVIHDKIVKTLLTYPLCHILVCAPTNKTCDVITWSLQEVIPDIFRANAAFRELDGVPLEIVPNCRYKKECFSCPPLKELREFKVVVSTFMSAFRLHNEGVTAGHFSHIFLVDASSIIEPEAMVALANLADDTTKVVVSGKLENHSSWVRSNIARRHGLMVSFFERIRKSNVYLSLDPDFITQIADSGSEGF